jgi:hypothetical protein
MDGWCWLDDLGLVWADTFASFRQIPQVRQRDDVLVRLGRSTAYLQLVF